MKRTNYESPAAEVLAFAMEKCILSGKNDIRDLHYAGDDLPGDITDIQNDGKF